MAGMMTRLMDGGHPATVAAVGLWEAARAHVEPNGTAEEFFLRTTPFLSFTEIQACAARYALGRDGRGVLVPHAGYGEATTIFELDTAGMSSDGEPGLFTLDYSCDLNLAVPLGEGPEYAGEPAALRCEYC